jgi:predicted DNA repair protein MutK
MSGLLALLDDVAAIAKVAAASVDDIAGAAAKAGAKAAGVVIDDTAVTPTYATGFAAERELPIIGRIALGSLKNKLFFLLPIALLLANFLPGAIVPLLTLGGAYLCFEGAEKVFHALLPHADAEVDEDFDVADPAHLEQEKVTGAIKTDFILSAEIMTIALGAIPESTFWVEAATLAVVGVAITMLVYGSVALIVKMDDIGLFLARNAYLPPTRALGRGLVIAMPHLLSFLSTGHRRDALGRRPDGRARGRGRRPLRPRPHLRPLGRGGLACLSDRDGLHRLGGPGGLRRGGGPDPRPRPDPGGHPPHRPPDPTPDRKARRRTLGPAHSFILGGAGV